VSKFSLIAKQNKTIPFLPSPSNSCGEEVNKGGEEPVERGGKGKRGVAFT
jgi:hypothetical protein